MIGKVNHLKWLNILDFSMTGPSLNRKLSFSEQMNNMLQAVNLPYPSLSYHPYSAAAKGYLLIA